MYKCRQPRHAGNGFQLNRGSHILEKWNKIPTDTDILITHGPPYGNYFQFKSLNLLIIDLKLFYSVISNNRLWRFSK